MSDVNANIRVNVSTQEAQAQLAALQQQMNLLNKSMTNNMSGRMDMGLGNVLPQLKGVHGEIVKVDSAAQRLNSTLSKGGTLKLRESWTNVQGALKKNSATMELARRNAAELGKQYTLLGKEANGAMTAFKGGQMAGFNMDMRVAAQRSAILSRAIDQMGTSVLNWGKNMQWAGRQLMVGFTVPLTIFSAFAIKSFQDIEREIVNLRKVYGDFGTSAEETDRVTGSIRELSTELTKLGFTAKETLGLAADAAALGFADTDLINVTTKATEMAALGMMTQAEALNTVISLNSAFGVSVDNLGGSLDFLNAVENETILSLQDMSEAIPITATAIQGLGGDVQDLAVFMVAMREGGINANEAANSLKTSLARLISPTRQAKETAAQFGISLQELVANNEGDVLGMVQALAREMESLSNLQQQQLLSDVFGKRQFARMGALLNNINKEGSQAAKTLELMGMNAADLARITQDELNTLEESPVMQLNKSIQSLQASLAPIGKMIAEIITPVLDKLGGLLNWFNNLDEVAQKFAIGFAAAIGVILPGVVMFIGLMGNLVGTLLNGIARVREFATGNRYLATEEISASVAAEQLDAAQMGVNATLQQQSAIVNQLALNYDRLVASMARVPAGAQTRGMPMKFATGGRVPGVGNTDRVPALLTPGEFVINKSQSQKHAGFLSALNSGSVKGFVDGGMVGGIQVPVEGLTRGARAELSSAIFALIESVGNNTEAQKQMQTKIQGLVDVAADNARARTGKDAITYEDLQGVQNPDRKSTQDKWDISNPRNIGTGALLSGGGYLSNEAELARIIPGSNGDRRIQAKRKWEGRPEAFAEELRKTPKLNEAGRVVADEIVEGLLSQKMTVDQAVDALFERLDQVGMKQDHIRSAVGLSRKMGGTDASHVVDSTKLTGDAIMPFVDGKGDPTLQKLVQIAGKNNVQLEFMRDYVLDMPSSVNQGLKGEGRMSGLQVKQGFEQMAARGKGPGDTLRKQWLSERANAEKGLTGDALAAARRETSEGLAAIKAAEEKFLAQIRGLDDDVVVVEGALTEAQDGVVSLNTMVETEVTPVMQSVSTAMDQFIKDLQQFGTDMRLAVNPEGIRNIEAAAAGDDGIKTTYKGKKLKTVHVDGGRFDLNQQFATGITDDKSMAAAMRSLGMAPQAFADAQRRNYSSNASHNIPGGYFGAAKGKNALGAAPQELQALIAQVKEGTMSLEQFNIAYGNLSTTAQAASDQVLQGTQAFDYLELEAEKAAMALQGLGIEIGPIGSQTMTQYIQGMQQALRAALPRLEQEGVNVGESVDDGVKKFLQIASPSKLAMMRGRQWVDGIVQSIKAAKGRLKSTGAEAGQALDVGFQSTEEYRQSPMGMGFAGITGRGAPLGGKPTQKEQQAKVENSSRFSKGQYSGMIGGQLVSMVGMSTMMFGDMNSEMAKTTQMTSMFGGQIMSITSMIPGLGAGLGALVGGLMIAGGLLYGKYRDSIQKASDEAYEMAKSLGGAANAAEKMAKMLGRTTAAQRQAMVGLDDEQKELYSEFTKSFESDMGKQILGELSEISGVQRTQLAEDYVLAAMTNNQLSDEEAKLFARALGSELNDGALGKSLERFVDENSGTSSSQAAKMQAEKRDRSIAESDVLNRDQTTIKGYMSALGAAQNGLEAWTTVVATAKEDYRDGEISYNEYIDSLRRAQEAQDEYANKLFDLAGKSPDPSSTKKAIEQDLILEGYSTEEIENSLSRMLDSVDNDKGFREFFDNIFSGRSADAQFDPTRNLQKAELVQLRATLMGLGESLESATAKVIQLTDDSSVLSKTYKEQIKAGKGMADAIEYATTEQNAIAGAYGSEFEGNEKEQVANRQSLLSGLDSYQKVGGEATQYLAAIEGFSGDELINFLQTANSLFRPGDVRQYVDAMAALNEVAGPKTAAAMSDTFAAIADDQGKIAKVSEEVAELSGYLNNNDESAERWVKYIETKNGKTDDDALADANKRLAEFQGMDKQYLLKIGIDVEQPEAVGLLGEEFWDPDRAAQAEDYVMSQAEGWQQDFAGAAVMGAGSFELIDGEAIRTATEKSLNEIALASAELNDAVEAMGDEDIEVQKKATVDFIMTSAEGQGIDIDAGGAQAMIDNVIARSGLDEATFYSMPADDIAKIINFEVIATGAAKAALVFDKAAAIAFDSGDLALGQKMKQQATDMRALAKMSQDSAAAATTSGLSRSDTTKGGSSGGGGGKESNWLIDLEKTFENNKKVLERIKKMRDQEKGLSEEIMRSIAEDEEAWKDYQSGKYSPKQIKKMYYANIVTDANKQTDEMRTQSRRENKVKSAGYDYFTEQQILNDPELLELFDKKPKQAARIAAERAEIETTILDRYERQVDLQQQQNSLYKEGLNLAILRAEQAAEDDVLKNGKDRAQMEQENAEWAAKIKVLEMEQIKPKQYLIEEERNYIK